MIQVTIGITVGLFASTALIFTFTWIADWRKGQAGGKALRHGGVF